MPPVAKHLKISLDRTGKEYREVHEWLDDTDPEVKAKRHDVKKIGEYGSMISEQYGTEGLQEYIMHIQDDMKTKFGHIMEDFEKAMSGAMEYFGIKEVGK